VSSAPVITDATREAVTDYSTVLTQRRVRPGEVLFRLALQFCLLVGFAFLISLLAYCVYKGWDRLDSRLWTEQPTGRVSRVQQAGVESAIYGTIWVITVTAAICLPVGIASAIYLEEYANTEKWYNRLLELNIQNLAGVPSIVFGILGLGLIARLLGLGFTVLTAAIVLSLLVLPTVIIASREALRSVPRSIRLASYALGATRWQTTWRQTLPAAVPGMATGAILALSRAIGEAAPLILLGAVSFIRFNPDSLLASYTTLPIQIFNLIKQPQEEYQELASAAIVLLLVILLLMNSVAIFIRNRFQKSW
jgi:phosphate transport system permease protein